VQPRRLTLYFQSDLTRLVPVRPPPDVPLDAGTVRFEPESVRIAGPRRSVVRIAAVHPMRRAMPVADSGTFLVPLDTGELGVRVRPSRVMTIVSPPANGVSPSGGTRADSARAGTAIARP
jgi:hypothetical protein